MKCIFANIYFRCWCIERITEVAQTKTGSNNSFPSYDLLFVFRHIKRKDIKLKGNPPNCYKFNSNFNQFGLWCCIFRIIIEKCVCHSYKGRVFGQKMFVEDIDTKPTPFGGKKMNALYSCALLLLLVVYINKTGNLDGFHPDAQHQPSNLCVSSRVYTY